MNPGAKWVLNSKNKGGKPVPEFDIKTLPHHSCLSKISGRYNENQESINSPESNETTKYSVSKHYLMSRKDVVLNVLYIYIY